MQRPAAVALAFVAAGAVGFLFWEGRADPVADSNKAIDAERLRAENEKRSRQLAAERTAKDEERKKRTDRVEAALERLQKEGISRDDVKSALEDEIVEALDLDDMCHDRTNDHQEEPER